MNLPETHAVAFERGGTFFYCRADSDAHTRARAHGPKRREERNPVLMNVLPISLYSMKPVLVTMAGAEYAGDEEEEDQEEKAE